MSDDLFDFSKSAVNVQNHDDNTIYSFQIEGESNCMLTLVENGLIMVDTQSVAIRFKDAELSIIHWFDDESLFEIKIESEDTKFTLDISLRVYSALEKIESLAPYRKFLPAFDDQPNFDINVDPRIDKDDIEAIKKGDLDKVINKLKKDNH